MTEKINKTRFPINSELIPSLFLICCLVFSCLPITALADYYDDEPELQIIFTFIETDTTGKTLRDTYDLIYDGVFTNLVEDNSYFDYIINFDATLKTPDGSIIEYGLNGFAFNSSRDVIYPTGYSYTPQAGKYTLISCSLPDGYTWVNNPVSFDLSQEDANKAANFSVVQKFLQVEIKKSGIIEQTPNSMPSSWAVDQVNSAIAKNLVPQSLQSEYTQNITRAEFCALAVPLYEKLKGEITERGSFADTTDINVQKIGGLGVVTGVGNNNFNPGGEITRQEAALILSRLMSALDKPLAASTPAFGDNDKINSWAKESVGAIQASGIMTGNNNKFDPAGKYTREQSILTLLRVWDIVK